LAVKYESKAITKSQLCRLFETVLMTISHLLPHHVVMSAYAFAYDLRHKKRALWKVLRIQ